MPHLKLDWLRLASGCQARFCRREQSSSLLEATIIHVQLRQLINVGQSSNSSSFGHMALQNLNSAIRLTYAAVQARQHCGHLWVFGATLGNRFHS